MQGHRQTYEVVVSAGGEGRVWRRLVVCWCVSNEACYVHSEGELCICRGEEVLQQSSDEEASLEDAQEQRSCANACSRLVVVVKH